MNSTEAKDGFTMSLELVPTATAAFIAGLSDRQMQRVVDEEIIGSPLVKREGVRGFAVMTTALAKFYFALALTRIDPLPLTKTDPARVGSRSTLGRPWLQAPECRACSQIQAYLPLRGVKGALRRSAQRQPALDPTPRLLARANGGSGFGEHAWVTFDERQGTLPPMTR